MPTYSLVYSSGYFYRGHECHMWQYTCMSRRKNFQQQYLRDIALSVKAPLAIRLSTLPSEANDLFGDALWLDNELSALAAQSLPNICKAPTANRQRRWASYPTRWSTATLDSVATSCEKTIIFNQLHIINHEVVYPKKNTHLIIHTNLVHFHMV